MHASALPKPGIVVTGCSSGIGRAVAEYLAARDFTVFATVRKPADVESLRALGLPDLVPICPLDLAVPDQIDAAAEVIKTHLRARGIELFAIVNNAGGGSITPVELMDVDGFRTEVEARIVGPVALAQALLPMIRHAHGRILWIVTPALMPIPFVSSIHACDFAVNCLARTMQLELKPWNIPSILIRCGGIQTAAPAKTTRELQHALQQRSGDRFELYADKLAGEVETQAAFDARRTDPVEVAKVVHRALVASKPKRRYRVGYMSGLAAMMEYLPQTWVDAIMERRG